MVGALAAKKLSVIQIVAFASERIFQTSRNRDTPFETVDVDVTAQEWQSNKTQNAEPFGKRQRGSAEKIDLKLIAVGNIDE